MLGTLFAGVIVGQIGIKIAPETRIIFFDLFLFATGYKVGPQFFYGLKKEALPQLTLTLVICVSCLLAAYAASKLMGYDVGTAAGLLAGAFSESTVIGTAGDAIERLSLPAEEKQRLVNNIPVAYAVTYLVGTTALVWFLSSAAARMLGINLRKGGGENFGVCRNNDETIQESIQHMKSGRSGHSNLLMNIGLPSGSPILKNLYGGKNLRGENSQKWKDP
jgi:putative transport protein